MLAFVFKKIFTGRTDLVYESFNFNSFFSFLFFFFSQIKQFRHARRADEGYTRSGPASQGTDKKKKRLRICMLCRRKARKCTSAAKKPPKYYISFLEKATGKKNIKCCFKKKIKKKCLKEEPKRVIGLQWSGFFFLFRRDLWVNP